MLLNATRNLIGHAVRRRLRKRFQQAMAGWSDCRAVQHNTLLSLLRLNQTSAFSQDHALQQVRNIEEFRERFPVAGFDRVASYVERVKLGEASALLGRENRLLMFALTSGTTNSSKFIPITRRFLDDYRRGWQWWGIQAFDDHPGLHGRTILQLVSDWDKFRTPANIPCGSISGLVQRMQKPILRSMYTVPAILTKLSDPESKYYLALKRSLCSRNLGMITTANPSTLVQLFRMLARHAEDLVRDLYDGTDQIGTTDLVPRRFRLIKNVRRARECSAILDRTGTLNPRDVWPELQLVSVWTAGSAANYLGALREFIGDLPIRDHGLHASEGRMTIPFEDESSAGILDISSHFFEFIPEREAESANPIVLQAHELQAGESYFIVLTTASGLYRYDIQDVVECTGFRGTVPLLRFLHKGAHICNLTGEKLTESQVVQAMNRVSGRIGLRTDYFTVAPVWGEVPRYTLLADAGCLPPIFPLSEIGCAIDGELQQLNLEYQDKRKTGRLAPLTVQGVASGGWAAFLERRQTSPSGNTEQYKHPFLVPNLDFINQFQPSGQDAVSVSSAA
jgi:hypothetical protein